MALIRQPSSMTARRVTAHVSHLSSFRFRYIHDPTGRLRGHVGMLHALTGVTGENRGSSNHSFKADCSGAPWSPAILPEVRCRPRSNLTHDCPERQGNLTFRVALSSRFDTKVRSFDLIRCDAMAHGARRQSRDGYSLRFSIR